MALNFPHASVLGVSQQSRFFGAGFNYSNTKELSLEGNLIDLAASFGITGIWTGIEGLVATVANNQNFQPLIINGVNFGSGRIQNISFSPGIDVKTKSYSANLVVAESGSLANFGGTFYSNVNTASWQYLQTFSEDYAFTRKENGGYSYTHNANIQFTSGVGSLNSINTAKTFAQSLFQASNLGIAFYSGYTSKVGKRFYTESYNLIDNTCQFGETFDFDSNSGNYSVTRTNQYQLAQNGIITVAESAQIRGIVSPTYQSATNALATEMGGAYARCNELFTLYAPDDPYPLITSPVVSNRAIDIFNNSLGYAVTFTNDISVSTGYTWDYTQQMTYSEGIARLQENGSVVGRARNADEAYKAARGGFATVKNGAADRADDFYTEWVSTASNFLETQQTSYSPPNGRIEYEFVYSNEQVRVGTNGVKRIDFTVQNQNPVYRYTKFGIFNEKEIVQDEQTSTVGNSTIALTLLGEKPVSLSTYLDNAKTVVNELIDEGYFALNPIELFLVGADYTFVPNQNTVTLNTSHIYNKTATKSVSVL